MGEAGEPVNQTVHRRNQAKVEAFTQHQSVGQVVDVLGGAGKVDKFGDRVELRHLLDFFLDEILNGFDIVVGGAFDGLDAFGVGKTEPGDYSVQETAGMRRESWNLGDQGVRGQFLQPADFYRHPVSDQAIFAENIAKNTDFIAIATVNRGNGCQRGKRGVFHRKPLKSSRIV